LQKWKLHELETLNAHAREQKENAYSKKNYESSDNTQHLGGTSKVRSPPIETTVYVP
jgi:hypothetical protein